MLLEEDENEFKAQIDSTKISDAIKCWEIVRMNKKGWFGEFGLALDFYFDDDLPKGFSHLGPFYLSIPNKQVCILSYGL